MKKWGVLSAAAMILICFEGRLHSGSLEKFQLPPVQRQSPYTYHMKDALRPETVPDLPVYRDFRSFVRKQSSGDLDRMIETYSSRKLQAVKEKNWSKATYYSDLVNILLN